jgi:hypothetical protein
MDEICPAEVRWDRDILNYRHPAEENNYFYEK